MKIGMGALEKEVLYPKLNKGHVAKQELNPNLQSLGSDPSDNNWMNLDECYLCLKDMCSH